MSKDTIDKKIQDLDDKILVFYNLDKLDQGKTFASRKLNIESSYINGADEEEISKQLDSLGKDIDLSMFSIIQVLEGKIRSFYLAQENQMAASFKKRLFDIEMSAHQLRSVGASLNYETCLAIQQLEADILAFENRPKTQDPQEEKNQLLVMLEKNVLQIIGSSPTQDLLSSLSTITEEWQKQSHDAFENLDFTRNVRNAVLDILISSSKKGEEIDLSVISKFCGVEDFINAMQDRLITISQKQQEEGNQEVSLNTLNTARYLRVENMDNTALWQLLTGKDDVKVKGIDEKAVAVTTKSVMQQPTTSKSIMQSSTPSPSTTALAVINPKKVKKTLFTRRPKTSIYTFGDINPETGKWENVKQVAGAFPYMRLSKKQLDRLLAIEINDVKTVRYLYSDSLPFKKARNLQKIIFGRVERIVYECCSEHPSLSVVEISDNVKYLGDNVFTSCRKLSKVLIGQGLTKIEDGAFASCTSLDNVVLPDTIEEVGRYAFSKCSGLSSISFGQALTFINEKAFQNCISLRKLDFPDSLQYINYGAFYNCRNLSAVHFGKDLMTLGRFSFENCLSLKSIEIPRRIRSIYDYAFKDCENLESFTIDPEVQSIETGSPDDPINLLIEDLDISKSLIFQGCRELLKARKAKLNANQTRNKGKRSFVT